MAPQVNESCKEMRRLLFEVNVAVSPEKQLSSLWRCKPDKYYTALPKLNMQTFAPVFFGAEILTIAKQKF